MEALLRRQRRRRDCNAERLKIQREERELVVRARKQEENRFQFGAGEQIQDSRIKIQDRR